MAEGLLAPGGTIASGVHDDPDSPPEPTAEAPRGWVWNRRGRNWMPRQRGPVLWAGEAAPAGDSGTAGADDARRDRDPDPGWMRDDSGSGRDRPKAEDVPAKVRDDIAGTAGLIGVPLLAFIQQVDPYCGGVLAGQYQQVIDACMPLICRSERVVKYFSGESDLMIWLGLGLALKPVAAAVWQHHVTRTVEVVRDEHGIAHVVARQREGEGDHLTPPVQPEYSYEA